MVVSEEERHRDEVSVILFFMVYVAFALVFSPFYLMINCDNVQCSINITNWQIFGIILAIGMVRILGYIIVKRNRRQQREKQEETEEIIRENQQ